MNITHLIPGLMKKVMVGLIKFCAALSVCNLVCGYVWYRFVRGVVYFWPESSASDYLFGWRIFWRYPDRVSYVSNVFPKVIISFIFHLWVKKGWTLYEIQDIWLTLVALSVAGSVVFALWPWAEPRDQCAT